MSAPEMLGPVLSGQPSDIASVDRLLNAPAFEALLERHGRTQVTAALREHLTSLRHAALAGSLARSSLSEAVIAAAVEARLAESARAALRPVFNLTGTVLHTNLGRALLPEEAVRAVALALTTPVNLEFDLDSGERGERDTLVEGVLCELTGAEAATVVNNNAAGVLLMLGALASRREVIVSRGELIEIGGSFRLPDIMRRAGAKLVEVGTTNRTHGYDYAQALSARTALLMKVHTSNYAISGFTSAVALPELVELGRGHGVPVAVDLGSGSLVDLTRWQLPAEPTVRDAVAASAARDALAGRSAPAAPRAGPRGCLRRDRRTDAQSDRQRRPARRRVAEPRPRHPRVPADGRESRASRGGAAGTAATRDRPPRRKDPVARSALPRGGRRSGVRGAARDAQPMIIGTAGHIDHGKTTLVRSLTGVDTDRLAAEAQV